MSYIVIGLLNICYTVFSIKNRPYQSFYEGLFFLLFFMVYIISTLCIRIYKYKKQLTIAATLITAEAENSNKITCPIPPVPILPALYALTCIPILFIFFENMSVELVFYIVFVLIADSISISSFLGNYE